MSKAIPCQERRGGEHLHTAPAGVFEFQWLDANEPDGIFIVLPVAGLRYFTLSTPQPDGSLWQWDGNRKRPTLMPSLNVPGLWHGWLRDGQLIEA